MVLNFGKYLGKDIKVVPSSYLRWMLDDSWTAYNKKNAHLIEEVKEELRTREKEETYNV